MRSSVVAALGAAVIAVLGASSAARAGTIDFGVTALGNSITYTGTSLELSTALDLDQALLLVSSTGSTDESGLTPEVSTVTLSAASFPFSNIVYGSAPGPLLPANYVTISWTGSSGAFTETLTAVEEIARYPKLPDAISVTLSGTVTGPSGSGFDDTPVSFVLGATQAGGPGGTTDAMFTNSTSMSVIPEASTWEMMALGFGALGYAASRRRKANLAALSI
jgi:hypothetical protein